MLMSAGLSCFCLVFRHATEAGSRSATSSSITDTVVVVEQEGIGRYGIQWFHGKPSTTT